MKTLKFEHVMLFKITLRGSSPLIWRRIAVPETYTFWDLHVAIQDAMGWLDCHLHAYYMIHPDTGERCEIGIPFDDGAEGLVVVPGWEVLVSEWFSEEQPATIYLYDFGDSWEQVVELEGISPRENRQKYPLCLEGEGACPPEDCGGIWGYQDLLAILSDPDHEDHEEMLEWLGEPIDPNAFDKNDVIFSDPRKRWNMTFE